MGVKMCCKRWCALVADDFKTNKCQMLTLLAAMHLHNSRSSLRAQLIRISHQCDTHRSIKSRHEPPAGGTCIATQSNLSRERDDLRCTLNWCQCDNMFKSRENSWRHSENFHIIHIPMARLCLRSSVFTSFTFSWSSRENLLFFLFSSSTITLPFFIGFFHSLRRFVSFLCVINCFSRASFGRSHWRVSSIWKFHPLWVGLFYVWQFISFHFSFNLERRVLLCDLAWGRAPSPSENPASDK